MMINLFILTRLEAKELKFIANENEGKVPLSDYWWKFKRVTSFLGENMAMASKNYINSQSSAVINRNHSLKGQMNNNAWYSNTLMTNDEEKILDFLIANLLHNM